MHPVTTSPAIVPVATIPPAVILTQGSIRPDALERLPVNLSSDEIRAMVRDILG